MRSTSRVNDVLLRVNDVDVSSVSKETVQKAIHAASTTINLRVRRKKSIGRFNVTVVLNLNKKGQLLALSHFCFSRQSSQQYQNLEFKVS